MTSDAHPLHPSPITGTTAPATNHVSNRQYCTGTGTGTAPAPAPTFLDDFQTEFHIFQQFSLCLQRNFDQVLLPTYSRLQTCFQPATTGYKPTSEPQLAGYIRLQKFDTQNFLIFQRDFGKFYDFVVVLTRLQPATTRLHSVFVVIL
jgi:hypothetical protein